MAKVVHVHVGLPKTGTTFLQSVVRQNRGALKRAGLLSPFTQQSGYFSAYQIAQAGGDTTRIPADARKRWSRLTRQARRWGSDVLVTHEALCRLEPHEIDTLVGLLASGQTEVRVLLTARSLARQVPSTWQQTVKSGGSERFAAFVEAIRSDPQARFWREQDAARVVRDWGARIGFDKVTVVTVPPKTTGDDDLWSRFARVVGVDPTSVDVSSVPLFNASIGAADVELIRRLNEVGRSRGENDPAYFRAYKRRRTQIGGGMISSRERTEAPTYPSDLHPWVVEHSQRIVDDLARSGCRIEGTLDDLAAGDAPPPGLDPDSVTDLDVAERAPEVLEDVLVEFDEQLRAARGEDPGPRGPNSRFVRQKSPVRRQARRLANRIL